MTQPLTTATPFTLSPRRARYFNVGDAPSASRTTDAEIALFEQLDLLYRTTCSLLFNFVPTSGHPGGSISSGRIVQSLLFHSMDYDFADPDRPDADMISYAAGHKAMGLYALWALRNELVRQGAEQMGISGVLAAEARQLRLEDLLGFRRNPTNGLPLFRQFSAKPLDGHPTCATPFIKIATGASGVGVPATLGLALGALDLYPSNPPKVHMLEGEGGMTPGRVHEALAAASSMQMANSFLHVDWNQASIDSNHVCREDGKPGDYVQWDPKELCYVHDWNVIFVPEGHNFRQILAAQELAAALASQQPTAIVYRTTKGWKYGMEGRDSHGAGHKFCSDGYFQSLKECEGAFGVSFPHPAPDGSSVAVEQAYFDSLMTLRQAIKNTPALSRWAAERIIASKNRLAGQKRQPRANGPDLGALYNDTAVRASEAPAEVTFAPGTSVTLRDALGKSLNIINQRTRGAVLAASADLLGSTSVTQINAGYPAGFFNPSTNPGSRLLSIGGICEDAMGAFMAGVSSYGHHIGVTSSYSAFISALEHVAARLHGIGQQTHAAVTGEDYKTWIMINAHAGAKTGEDGPTHADPQALQLLQECFPENVMITLTPWDPQEIWPLLVSSLKKRPAILAPFVTRPAEKVVDRAALGLPPAAAAAKGVYAIRRADRAARQYNGTVVLQGNGVASIFVNDVLPRLERQGLNLDIYYITSAELFHALPAAEQEELFPEALTYDAMGITDFTIPTLYRWVRSNEGIRRSLHSFRGGHYLGSGSASKVLEEAGLHAEGQFSSILAYAAKMEKK
jgi:transketolase